MKFVTVLAVQEMQKILSVALLVNIILIYVFLTFRPYSKDRVPLKLIPYVIANDKYFIHTSGCTIPNYRTKVFHYNEEKSNIFCEKRSILVKKTSETEIVFMIKDETFIEFKKNRYVCCYRFVSRSDKPGIEDNNITYTQCKGFSNGTRTRLRDEVITVTCNILNRSSDLVYEDSYIILKKRQSTSKKKQGSVKWNVLILGMDTLSRVKVYDTMPNTTLYLQTQGWLDFRGYNKIAYNTYPNLMAFMTGLNQSNIYGELARKEMAWDTYKDQGYMTAYGEDFINCPDTFKTSGGFKKQPTDHYMRPLFLTGEKQMKHLLCTGKLSSGQHVLNYAYDFADTYKNDSFFGLFWMNSYSHDPKRRTSKIDIHVENFFKQLNTVGVLENTFIIFLSDHGTRFGTMREFVEAYYDERLPMLFMWIPPVFRELYSNEYNNAVTNQHRLLTPYDLHATLLQVLELSSKSFEASIKKNNKHSLSILEEHPEQRTCADAGISDKWCACHRLTKINKTIHDAKESIFHMKTHIINQVESIETQNCTICKNVKLSSVLRIHQYSRSDMMYYVIAMHMSPIEVLYEGVVSKNTSSNVYKMVEKVDIITSLNIVSKKYGYCTNTTMLKLQCRCTADPKCRTSKRNNLH